MGPTPEPGKYSKSGLRLGYTIATAIITSLAFVFVAQSGEKISGENEEAPRRHFRLKNPANLSSREAEAIYAGLQEQMAKGYAASGLAAAQKYQKWQRYNTVPFQSAAHGRRLVNHYANSIARAYGKYEKAGILPVGSIIAKDNVTVMGKDKIFPGALLLMEKMPTGFNYVSGNWRYTMIMPDGSIFGTTNGDGSDKVKFCISCHLAAEKHDHLHFVPKRFRRSGISG